MEGSLDLVLSAINGIKLLSNISVNLNIIKIIFFSLFRYRYRGDAEVLQLGEERDFSFFPKSLKLIGCPTN